MPGQDQYVIEILDVTLDVIEYFVSSEGRAPQPPEIARQLNINRSRVFRILKTLERRGYIEADPESRGYRLGLKFLEVGECVREQIKLRRVAEPILSDLANKTGDVVLLMVLHGHTAVSIDTFRGGQRLQVAVPLGRPTPLHIGAVPKILLACLPEQERERVIKDMELTRFTANTITDRDALRRCLEEIRSQGYAVAEEDYYLGEYSVGAPVRDHGGRVIAGISVTAPQTRHSPQRLQELTEMVIDAATRLSARLGHRAAE